MSSTTTTTTTKKPNDGPCAACNKEGAVLRCAPCRVAGVDVFFCNRECQVKLWKIHKAVCKKTSTSDSKKEQSGASKKDKQETKKGFKIPKPTELCANCLKTEVDIGFKVRMCSKCNVAYYCSRECQVEDWPKHKRICKQNCEFEKNIERSFDSREMNIYNLFEKWVPGPIFAAAYLALKKKGMAQQPPVKVVFVEVDFNYNAQTFIVTEEPRAVAIDDLSQDSREMIMEGWKHQNNKTIRGLHQVYAQYAIVSTKELGEKSQTNVPILFDKSELDQYEQNVDSSMFKVRFQCALVHLKSNLFRGWKSIRRSNLKKRMKQMELGQSYTAFVQNALQFFCSKSLQSTHQLVVDMKMGKEIGQISQLLDYKLWPMDKFEKVENVFNHVEGISSQPSSCTETAIKVLFLDIEISCSFEYTVFCGVNVIRNKTAKQCKKAADKHFRKLQQSVKEMPSDLLEKVSL
ncbi:hypothetical protein CTEN210_17830 [Chaetoceros tenuissimus]|uniref:MYND-type domain-containing protein n=1 Tax=Chaetoceros tenuissimus TaxID=426638 RepID=A0AAD3HFL3_9STRA|nr:hypothetical protein CTEN210_17830 [Chaetoceros tenuissimus]